MENVDRLTAHHRNDLHLMRRLWHISMGLVIVAIYQWLVTHQQALKILAGFLCFTLVIEWLRLSNTRFNEKVFKFWGPLIRDSEVKHLSGATYYILGALFTIAIFPKTIAVLALTYLAVGDPLASIVGILTKNKTNLIWKNGKSLLGTLAASIACGLVSWFYFDTYTFQFALLSVLGGVAGGLSELISSDFKLDDNLVIPIFSGAILWFLFSAFSISL